MQASTQKVELDGNWKLVLFMPLQPRIINVSCLQSLKMTHRKTHTSYIRTVCNQKWKQNLQILMALERIVECLRVARAIVPWCLSQILIKTKTSFVFHINNKAARGCDWLWHSHSSLALFHQVLWVENGMENSMPGSLWLPFSLMMAVPRRTSHWDEASTRLVEQLEPLHQHPGAEPWKNCVGKLKVQWWNMVKHRVSPSSPEIQTLIFWFIFIADYFSKSTVTFKRDDLLHRLHLHVLDSHREVHLDFSLYWKGPRCQGRDQHFSGFRYFVGWDTASGTEASQMGQKVGRTMWATAMKAPTILNELQWHNKSWHIKWIQIVWTSTVSSVE